MAGRGSRANPGGVRSLTVHTVAACPKALHLSARSAGSREGSLWSTWVGCLAAEQGPGAPLTLGWLSVGQKLFSCHVCSNAFSTKGSLKVHMRLHTGAKPFKCPHCELRFRTSGRRKTHMQFHYKPDPKKVRKPVTRSSPEGLQPASLLSPSSTDPNVFIMNNSVLTGQFDQNLQGLVGQAILPAAVSGKSRAGERPSPGTLGVPSCPGGRTAISAAGCPSWSPSLRGQRVREFTSPSPAVRSLPSASALWVLSFLMG